MVKIVKINKGFICKNCGHKNSKAKKTCRNHCRKCLYSLHVDENLPGDRLSKCYGLMKPIAVDYNSKKGYIIIHKCIKCGKISKNKVASDDNLDIILKIMKDNIV